MASELDISFGDIGTRTVSLPEIEMTVAEIGSGDPVVFLHGFPELWFSWRHQMPALAAAGFRAIAPNQRGYDGTTTPAAVEDFDILHLTGDVVALLDALELEQAVLVGHDWGAVVAWSTALIHPDRVRAVVGVSVPAAPRTPIPPMQFFRQVIGDDFYMLWLQRPGEADAAFAADVPRALAGEWVLDRHSWQDGPTPARPDWQTAEEHQFYVDALTRSGFTGGLNWYRNFDRNWELLASYDDRRIEQPALFVAGSEDPVGEFMPTQAMDGYVTDLRQVVILPGVNHWVAQERPEELNRALQSFLREIG